MPAAPVPASQVHVGIEQNIYSALEHIFERIAAKENGPNNASDQDAMKANSYTNTTKTSTSKGSSHIEGITKQSYVKQASKLKTSFVKVALYNTFYPQLEEHMKQVGIEATLNRWDEPIALGLVDPHDSISHPAGVSDCQTESATHLEPDEFTNFLISNWFQGEGSQSTKDDPFPLHEA